VPELANPKDLFALIREVADDSVTRMLAAVQAAASAPLAAVAAPTAEATPRRATA
jgi:ApbE superfamily uncharacterized protein (UPF0280 family)